MNVAAYLQRIGYNDSPRPTFDTLCALQQAHLFSVPFENLDVYLGRPIILDLPRIYDKVVIRRRGGFCYELNGLFGWLLQQLGFGVTLLSAGVARGDGRFGPEFDHLTLLVEPAQTSEQQKRWLVDVGFGDGFRQPLRFDDPGIQTDAAGAFKLTNERPYRQLWKLNEAGRWTAQYRFTLRGRKFGDFASMCRYHQTSPDSTFTHKRLCTLATPDGRVTLSGDRLIITQDGVRNERRVDNADEIDAILKAQFGIVLGATRR